MGYLEGFCRAQDTEGHKRTLNSTEKQRHPKKQNTKKHMEDSGYEQHLGNRSKWYYITSRRAGDEN